MARFVHRVHTIAELSEGDRCVACARATSRVRDADFGQNASTLFLTGPLPEVRVCEACDAEQLQAMKIGRKAIAVAMTAPIALVVLAAIVAPFGAPIVVVLSGFAGLLATRAVVAWVRRERARASRLLYVDGTLDEVILQLRLDETGRDALPYREEGREARTDGLVIRPVGPRVRATLAFIATTLAVLVACVVAWFGSYPTLVLDNPRAEDTKVTVDGVPVLLAAGGSARLVVGWGAHRVSIDDTETLVRVPWGQALLVSTGRDQCYALKAPDRIIPSAETTRELRGPIVVLDQTERALRTRCPVP